MPTARTAHRGYCQRCKPQSRARWTRELVRGAHRFWHERFGFIASSADWSGTHARRRGGTALKRYRSARWPSQSVIRRLYGTPEAARADAFPPLAQDVQPLEASGDPHPLFLASAANTNRSASGGRPRTGESPVRDRAAQPAQPV